ncbi:MAG: hypothetical protein AUK32_01580 [Candidatus Aquicultor secundus]|nr:site-2 protease family protein [Candidatus Aquicultor secundus]OIO88409.1 MAG: hypothetical protein AUK32_01580 [Candidatus Aquicultor secundus]
MDFQGIIYLLRIPALLIAVTVHEFMHGQVAYMFGDTTAKEKGRLSLNPIKHLDPLGTISLIVIGFGWAKPVPVNPYRFKNPARDMVFVGIAGPAANFIAAFLLARLFYFPMPDVLKLLLEVTVQINVMLGIFNLLPIPPLDGSKIIPYFLPRQWQQSWYHFEQYGMLVLILLLFIVPGFTGVVLGVPLQFMLKLVMFGIPVS